MGKSKEERLLELRAVCPHDCPDTCAMVVTVREENGGRRRALKVRGDERHPFTQGFLCLKVARYIDRVYHPDRLRTPLKRIGPKGSAQFAAISWDEAIETIARKFAEIAASPDGPEAILPYSYCGTMGIIQSASLDRRFFHRLGASRLDRTICATAGAAGCDFTLGTRAVVDPERVEECRLLINWGSNTKVTNSHLWVRMKKARDTGARVITIDPYRSRTAEASDQWIPIRPGTDAALALGLMHIIFRERWEDGDYLARYCLGTEALRQRVLDEYPPDRVASITGIDQATIEALAKDYASVHPSLIRVNYGLQRHYGGGMAVRTICCLPAIVGAWRHPGGGAMLSTSKLYPWNSEQLEWPRGMPAPGRNARIVNMVQLAEALLGELPGPPVKALYVYNSNPAAVCPDQLRVRKGLLREDLFTVVHEQFLTDTTDYADIVLPATTQLEHFDIHGSYGHTYVQVNEPVIPPLAEAKCNTDVFRLLARRLGFEPEYFDVSDEELARQALQFAPGGSGLCPDAFAGITLERLREEGPLRLRLPTDFAPFAKGGFPTPSGKCEFYSERLERMGFDPLPTYTPPCEDPQSNPELASKYPLQLISPPHPAFLNSTFVNIPALQRAAGEPTVKLHPRDAKSRGIGEGSMVRVFNDRGAFTARAEVTEAVAPGVAVAESIWWNRFSPGGCNCNATTPTGVTDLGGGATFFDNLVDIAECSD